MPEVFQPPKNPSVQGLSIREVANATRTQFEGQYAQRAETGPNPIARQPGLAFRNLTETERQELVGFLRARKGVQSFTYHVPGDDQARLWTCPEWTVAPEKSKTRWSVRFKLIEEFDIF